MTRSMPSWRERWGFPPARECEPTYRLDDYIAQARKEMGEEKWLRLNREWDA